MLINDMVAVVLLKKGISLNKLRCYESYNIMVWNVIQMGKSFFQAFHPVIRIMKIKFHTTVQRHRRSLYTSLIGWLIDSIPIKYLKSWWRHQMETFSALLAIYAGNLPVTGEFPSQRPVTRSFGVFLDLLLINNRVNNGEAGDLRRHHAHYDVIVMNRWFHEINGTTLIVILDFGNDMQRN